MFSCLEGNEKILDIGLEIQYKDVRQKSLILPDVPVSNSNLSESRAAFDKDIWINTEQF